jgi:hypothetical protein
VGGPPPLVHFAPKYFNMSRVETPWRPSELPKGVGVTVASVLSGTSDDMSCDTWDAEDIVAGSCSVYSARSAPQDDSATVG